MTDQITLDPELAHGPIKNRKCTDILCLLLALAAVAGSLAVASFAFANGDPEKLFHLVDNSQNTCGEPNTPLADFKYLYFLDIQRLNHTVCVSQCPRFNVKKNESKPDKLQCYPNRLTEDCKYGTKLANNQELSIYDSVVFMDKVCLPSSANTFASQFIANIGDTLQIPQAQQIYNDLKALKWALAAIPVIAVIIGSIYMLLLRFLTSLLVWGTIIFCDIVFAGITWAAYSFYTDPQQFSERFRLLQFLPPNYALYTAIAGAFITAIYTVIVLIFRTRISLTIGVLQCSTRFVNDMMSVLLLPPIFLVVDLIYVAWWAVVGGYLYTVGEIHPCPDGFPVKEITRTDGATYALWFHVFTGIWGFLFLLALNQFIVGFMTCMWYFSEDKHRGHKGSITRAISAALTCHIGSIAFGALVLNLFIFIKYLFTLLQKAAENDKVPSPIRTLLSIVNKLLTCCVGFVKFLNQHVYLEIAMTGEGFIGSATDAFLLMAKNAARFGFVHNLGALFVFLGEVCVTALTAFIGYFYITKDPKVSENIQNPVVTVGIIGLIGYVVGSNLMRIYGIAADGIVHCFCLDEELRADAKFTPEELRDLLSKRDEIQHKKEEEKAKKEQ